MSYYGYDGGGSVRELFNATGAITDTYDYDAFGNTVALSGSTVNEFLYRGEQFDSTLDLYYLRARYYNPRAGRFLTADRFVPTGAVTWYFPEIHHPFIFASADPSNKVDPSGHADVVLIEAEVSSYEAPLAAEAGVSQALVFGFANCAVSAVLTVQQINEWYADPNHTSENFPAWATANLVIECGLNLGAANFASAIPEWLQPIVETGEFGACVSGAGLYVSELSEWFQNPAEVDLVTVFTRSFEIAFSCGTFGTSTE